MKERPILFSAPMVRAILDGRKTVTRRVVDEARMFAKVGDFLPWFTSSYKYDPHLAKRVAEFQGWTRVGPYGAPGDRLWVKETWHPCARIGFDVEVEYRADESSKTRRWNGDGDMDAMIARDAWRPSIFMPRWASRISLDVISVSVERLHDITEADARAEGIYCDESQHNRGWHVSGDNTRHNAPTHAFRALWTAINGPESWAENPWVWRVEFRRREETR